MHKRYSRQGFTIVELLVVVIVIIILATITILGYDVITEQANDNKRTTDISALQHELENYFQKNGEYPAGCPATTCTTGNTNVTFNASSSKTLTSDTTLAQLRTVLPGLANDFGDPTDDSNYVFLDQDGGLPGSNQYRYIYLGGLKNSSSTAQNYTYRIHGDFFNCHASITLQPGQVSNYIVGYYGEQDNDRGATPSNDRWHLYHGANGGRFNMLGTVDGYKLWCTDLGSGEKWSAGGTIDN